MKNEKRDIFTELMEGLEAYAEFRRGKRQLKTIEVAMPERHYPEKIKRTREE